MIIHGSLDGSFDNGLEYPFRPRFTQTRFFTRMAAYSILRSWRQGSMQTAVGIEMPVAVESSP